jgi:hypothetical protein
MGESEASLFEGSCYGVNAFVRDENVIGEVCCLEEDGTKQVGKSISVAFRRVAEWR